jgi:hypothetical protein
MRAFGYPHRGVPLRPSEEDYSHESEHHIRGFR